MFAFIAFVTKRVENKTKLLKVLSNERIISSFAQNRN